MRQRHRGRILVIEDNSDLRESLIEILALSGFLASGAENGKAALEHLERSRTPPALVLLDLTMPVMDGASFLRRFRLISRFSKIPVLLMTAQNAPPTSEAVAVLSKPFTPASLLALVEQIFASAT